MSGHIEGFDPPFLIRCLKADFQSKWSPNDQGAALVHQLNAPLSPDLTELSEPGAIELKCYLESYSGPDTFQSQLLTKTPSLRILQAIKVFAKRIQLDHHNPLAGDPSSILYFAA